MTVKLTLSLLQSWHEGEGDRYTLIAQNYQDIVDRADRPSGAGLREGKITAVKRAQCLACKAEADLISDFHRQAYRLLLSPKKDI